ncbi:hypothetical protein BN59_01906 [Legionella massiliensis]|uniref:Phytanoyl-CoA dioxygenase (PhyH) n=1 Tax=Legionella massiliensis TaxID=1034943 RepID=A0A078KX53_9GAMM|nr:hypothetical protein [Legionella massiliensis]CDZ77622.1 hypothetical protein BN59_01906 [Legionella massiliensis]CEE13360.1 hypothetical protein BN1094_01906 [Legionella massiliensis]
MLNSQYLKGKFFHYLEYVRNRKNIRKSAYKYYPEPFYPWCGIDKIHLEPAAEKQRPFLIKKYTRVKGELDRVLLHNPQHLSYDDHVTRIKVKGQALTTASFSLPRLSDSQYQITDLLNLASLPAKFDTLLTENPQLGQRPAPFDYINMEQPNNPNKPACVGLPEGYDDSFRFNEEETLTENVLHLPLKVSAEKARELNAEGRVIAGSSMAISHESVYLPHELRYLKPFIDYLCQIEKACNPDFMQDYYIFLSVSHSLIPPGDSQRRGGWHIDGHQGYERLQKSGRKLPCDRQYLISNILPTETIACSFDFAKVRAYCQSNFCDLDSVNMQDVIEQQASHFANSDNVSALSPNRLHFLNPYMVHRAMVNPHDYPIKRTFTRILFSTFTRNRLGDSVNPVLGPIYPLKVKTIKDIHEIPSSIYLG